MLLELFKSPKLVAGLELSPNEILKIIYISKKRQIVVKQF